MRKKKSPIPFNSTHMKILFFDIETVPTEQSLQDNGLLESQIRLDEAEIIKKLSLSAATAKYFCSGLCLGTPAGLAEFRF